MKRYKNESTGEWYNEGSSIKRRTDEVLWFGVPTEEQLAEWGFTEYVAPTPEPFVPTYEELVVQKIRERYSIDDELAILRQRETKEDEFAEYNAYCEECKAQAREEVGDAE